MRQDRSKIRQAIKCMKSKQVNDWVKDAHNLGHGAWVGVSEQGVEIPAYGPDDKARRNFILKTFREKGMKITTEVKRTVQRMCEWRSPAAKREESLAKELPLLLPKATTKCNPVRKKSTASSKAVAKLRKAVTKENDRIFQIGLKISQDTGFLPTVKELSKVANVNAKVSASVLNSLEFHGYSRRAKKPSTNKPIVNLENNGAIERKAAQAIGGQITISKCLSTYLQSVARKKHASVEDIIFTSVQHLIQAPSEGLSLWEASHE
jgi:hypothetical protein